MYAIGELQRWAGRVCLFLGAAFAMLGYYYANVRFLPIMAGFTILAAVCYVPRVVASQETRSLRASGQRPAV